MDPTNGITCPDMRRVVREAIHGGWEWAGYTGTTHARLKWPKTGKVIVFGTTPGVASWKSVATDITKVSGVVVWRKGNRKRSRKAFKPSGFSLTHATHDAAEWHEKYGDEVGELRAAHERLSAELHRLIDSATRADIERFRYAYAEVRAVEERLERYHQPYVRFNPGVSDATG